MFRQRGGSVSTSSHRRHSLIAISDGSNNGEQRESRIRLVINGKPLWLHIDGIGIVCAAIVYMMLLFSQTVVIWCVLAPLAPLWGSAIWFHIILYNFIFAEAVTSHISCMITDPGCVPYNARALDGASSEQRLCKKCNSFKPRHAHHCSICGRCIIFFDHFCPWVNNAIGIMNQKMFIQFIISVLLLCMFACVLIFTKFSICEGRVASKVQCLPISNNSSFLVFCVLFIALIFGLFTLCMAIDQLSNFQHTETKVERLRMKVADKIDDEPTPYNTFQRVFGNVYSSNSFSFYIHFLLPMPPKYRPETIESIFGYREDDDSNSFIDESSPLINDNNINDNVTNDMNNDDAFSNDEV